MNNWENIKDELKKAETPLTDYAWSEMEQLLDADKKARGRYPWLWIAAAAIVLFLGVFFTAQQLSTDDTSGRKQNEGQPLVAQPKEQKKQTISKTQSEGIEEKQEVADDISSTDTQKRTEELSATSTSDKKENEETSVASVDVPKKENSREKLLIGQQDSQGEATLEEAIDKQALGFVNLPYKNIELPALAGSSPSPIKVGLGSSNPLSTADQQPKTNPDYRWELRAFAMSTYNLAEQDYSATSPFTHKSFVNASNNGVQADLGFDAGIELKYRFYKHFKLGGGIEFRRVNNQVDYAYENDQIPLIDSASGHIIDYFTAPEATQYSYTGTNSYTFISVPISMYYEYVLHPKWRLGAEAIYNHSFLIRQNSIAVNATSLTLDEQDNSSFKSSLGSAQFRLSLLYQLKPNTFIALEPSYRWYLNDFDQTEATSWRPQDISLSLSLIYRFNSLKRKSTTL